jgi:hypothetical protein
MPRISREPWIIEGLKGEKYQISGLPLTKRAQWLQDYAKFTALLSVLTALHPEGTFADFYDAESMPGVPNETYTPEFEYKVNQLLSAYLPIEDINADLAIKLLITYGDGKGILEQIEFSKSPYPVKKGSRGLPAYVDELTHVRASLLQSGADADTIRWITESIPWVGEGREMLAEMSRLADEAEKERDPKKKQGAAFDDEEADREFAELEKAMENSMATDPVFKLLAGQGQGG